MIINCPLSKIEEVVPLIREGAQEFYCGLLPGGLSRKTTDFELINRRPDCGANFSSIDELYKAKRIADKHNISISVALNEFYSQAQQEMIEPLLYDISKIGIKKVIVADIGILRYLADSFKNLEVVVSIMSSVFNPQAISALLEINPQIKKIILPYHLSFEEIKEITDIFPKIIFETFIFNELCHYEVGLCNLTHNPYRKNMLVSIIKRSFSLDHRCQKIFQDYLPERIQNSLFELAKIYPCYLKNNEARVITDDLLIKAKQGQILKTFLGALRPQKVILGCGVCFLPQLTKAGIKCIKIGGRNNSARKKIRNLRFVTKCINAARKFDFEDRKDLSPEYREMFSNLFHTDKSTCNDFCVFSDSTGDGVI